MPGARPFAGPVGYVKSLLMVAIFPWFWARSFALAKRHEEADAQGRAKVAIAIVLSVVIAGGGFMALSSFQSAALDGMYESLDSRLVAAVGEKEYRDHEETVRIKTKLAGDMRAALLGEDASAATFVADVEDIAERHTALLAAQRSGSDTSAEVAALAQERDDTVVAYTDGAPEKAAGFASAFATAHWDRVEAGHAQALQAPSHAFYVDTIKPAVEARDDAAAHAALASTSLSYDKMQERAARAYEIKDKAVADMETMYTYMLYPSLWGAFIAPLFFANGSILNRAYKESETIGFKKYPGAAAGLFLLVGAFGVPAPFFAAWAAKDIEDRSAEGQIAL